MSNIAPALHRERERGVWDYISPTRLNLWLRCPLVFRLRYIDGVVPPTSASLFLGAMVHRSLEWYHRNRQLDVEVDAAAVAAHVQDAWDEAVDDDNVCFQSTAEEQALLRQAVALVTTYLDQVPDDEPKPLVVETFIEAPLIDPSNGEDLGIPLVGIVDLVIDGDEGALLVDVKTTARGGRPPDAVHEIQLSSYSYLFRHASGRQETALEIRALVKTKTPRLQFLRHEARTEAHFRRLFAVIRAYLDDLASERFIFRPSFGCHMCDFRDSHCQEWSGLHSKPV